MKTSNLLLFMTFCAIALFSSACTQKQKPVENKRVIEQNSGEEIAYQEVTTKMENYKAIIIKHEDIYNLAKENTGSVLNNRQLIDASKEIIANSNQLLILANNTLKNAKIIQNVSGGKENILNYKKFAEQKINQYD